MKKWNLFLPVYILLSQYGSSQNPIDNTNLYSLRITVPDSIAHAHHLKSWKIFKLDSNNKKSLLTEEYFDNLSYLTGRIRHEHKQPVDTEILEITRNGPNEFSATDKITREVLFLWSQEPDYKLIYEVAKKRDTPFFITVRSIYKLEQDTGIDITTYVDGKKVGSIHTRSLFAPPNNSKKAADSMDSTLKGDSLIITRVNSDTGALKLRIDCYYVKGINQPVKVQYYNYDHDAITKSGTETWIFDNKKRLTMHTNALKEGKEFLLRQKIEYDDSSGEITWYNNDMLGINDNWYNKTYKYNKLGQLLELTKTDYLDKNIKHTSTYYYDSAGLLTKLAFTTDGRLEFQYLYQYEYY